MMIIYFDIKKRRRRKTPEIILINIVMWRRHRQYFPLLVWSCRYIYLVLCSFVCDSFGCFLVLKNYCWHNWEIFLVEKEKSLT